MSKSSLFTGQPIFTQLLRFIPRGVVSSVSKRHASDHYYKRFFFYDHLVSMLVCSFHGCTSLRELTTGMQVYASRLQHFGVKHPPRRSTLSEANKNRSADAFEDLFHRLIKRLYQHSPDSQSKEELGKLLLIDSTTITLFKNIMKGAGNAMMNGRKKGGVKAHVLFDANQDAPSFVRISEARVHDKTFLKMIPVQKDSVLVFDKAYNDYNLFKKWTDSGVCWVTRINKAAVYQERCCTLISSQEAKLGVISDSLITLGNPVTRKKTPLQTARLVVFYHEALQRKFSFLTNDLDRPASEIADLYKQRWQIEIFFKRLKQNMPLKYFLGDNENAIRIQIWCTLIADLLIKLVLEKVVAKNKRQWSFANLASIIRLHLGTYVNLKAFLENPEQALRSYKPPPLSQYELQLN